MDKHFVLGIWSSMSSNMENIIANELIKSKEQLSAINLIKELNEKGFEAYLVGGCVRDIAMGLIPHDYDITTNAKPNQILEIFGGKQMGSVLKREGEEFGTVTVKRDNFQFEITTFRKEIGYSDGRHPDKVEWTNDLVEDLHRRDFTINAMAIDKDGHLIDPFNGKSDILNKKIRAVSKVSFAEDKLRILRALRFSARFNFGIEDETYKDMGKYAHQVMDTIAKERINAELVKMFGYKYIAETLDNNKEVIGALFPFQKLCMGFDQHSKYHHLDVWSHMIEALKWYRTIDEKMDYRGAIAVFLHDIGKPNCYQIGTDGYWHYLGHEKASTEIAKVALEELRFKREDIKLITALIANHDFYCKPTRIAVRKFMKGKSNELIDLLFCIRYADIMAHKDTSSRKEQIDKWEMCINLINQIRQDNDCLSLSQLAINGNRLQAWGITNGKEIGEILNYTLDAVITERVNNDLESILKWKYMRKKLKQYE